jgi:soluble lytic murein transglycosylase-like protein
MKILFILLLLLLPTMSSESIFHYKWETPEIRSIVEREAQKHNINPKIIYRLIEAESSGRARLDHPVIKIRLKGKLITTRAIGLMGIVAEYHHKGKRSDLYNPALNIKTGCQILANCRKRAKGNMAKALQYYNGQVVNINIKYVNKILRGVTI